jgi:hypothetical protein
LILECASCRDCTLEAMRTQVCANQCIDCTVVLFAHTSIIYDDAADSSITYDLTWGEPRPRHYCRKLLLCLSL